METVGDEADVLPPSCSAGVLDGWRGLLHGWGKNMLYAGPQLQVVLRGNLWRYVTYNVQLWTGPATPLVLVTDGVWPRDVHQLMLMLPQSSAASPLVACDKV